MKTFAFLRKNRMALGRQGESFAAEYFERNGFTILARNWRTNAGELDIVARKQKDIYFVEVKTLHHKEGYTPAGNLSLKQRRRNFFAGKVFLALLGDTALTAHFDLVEIEYTSNGKFLSFKRHQDYLPVISLPAKKEKLQTNTEETVPLNGWQKFLRYLNFFPCPACGTGNGGGTGQLCPECIAQLKMIPSDRRCPGCGGTLDSAVALCSYCISSGSVPVWDGVCSVFEHSGLGRELILNFKYGGRSELARPLGRLGADAVLQSGICADTVLSIPAHWRRRLLRGYNQAELLGKCIAKYLDLPYCNALKRVKYSKRQVTLGRSSRLKNLKKAFVCIKPESIKNKRILLVDDVFTTGSTLTAAVEQLRKAHPAAVYILTISRRKALFKKGSVTGKR